MALPKINLRDGKHKMIVAEEGERVLTPQQNDEYEAQHPDVRKQPMQAQLVGKSPSGVYDGPQYAPDNALIVAGSGGSAPAPVQQGMVRSDSDLANKPAAKKPYTQLPGQTMVDVKETPLMNQEAFDCGGTVYDKGGAVQAAPSSTWDTIKQRAQEIYEEGKQKAGDLMKYPQSSALPEAGQIAEKTKMAEDLKRQGEAQAGTLPTQVAPTTPPVDKDKLNPMAKYGDKPGEVRPEQMPKIYDKGGDVDVEKDLAASEEKRRAEGLEKQASDTRNKMQPAYKVPEGQIPIPTYDDGGTVQDDEASKKDAALEQATREVQEKMEGKAEEHGAPADFGGQVLPNPKGIKVQSDTDRPMQEPQRMSGGATMNPGVYKGGMEMDASNTPKNDMEPGPMREAGAAINVPRPERMNRAPAPAAAAPEAPPTAPDPMDIIKQDKMAAMKKGDNVALGNALIHERIMKDGSKTTELAPETPAMPQYTGPGKSVPAGEAIPPKQLPTDEHKFKLQEYDKRIQSAMDQGTPEGDREAASLQLAKQHFKEINHLGTEGNMPGVGGKILHGLNVAGNIAGNIAAPGTMANIPGTALNQQRQAAKFRGQEAAATKESLEEAQARQANLGSKLPPPTQVFDDLKGQVNPETLEGGPLYDSKSPKGRPFTDVERLDVAQNPGKGAETTYARKYMKENPGSTYTDGVSDYHKMLAGTKPGNEMEKRVADRLLTNHLEDTPQNRDSARRQIIGEDVTAKQEAALPFSEAKSTFNDKLATVRAKLIQQNADADARGLKADELQNTENARSSSVIARIKTAKDALDNADEEQFAAQIVPITALLSVTSAEGVKRVNKQELDKFVPTSGSFGRWIDAHAEQFLEGKIPAEYRTEVGHMLDRMTAAETVEHIINSRSVDETIRQGAQTPVQTPKGGASSTPAPSKPQAPAAANPAGGGGFAAWKAAQKVAPK